MEALDEQQRAEYAAQGFVRLSGFADDVNGKAMLERVVEIAHRQAAGDRSTVTSAYIRAANPINDFLAVRS
ncbi:MAG: hypothetical protein M3527_02030 [Actinomycetota bacterium]|nr:hypothetical protein [Acidimicrobiia bacterium]MDQ3293221.1 hypothetical protein [Actinomycetota bacterium]